MQIWGIRVCGVAGVARVLLGALLVTSGFAKVPVFREFGFSLESVFGFGPGASFLSAVGVLGTEIIVGGMLVLGVRTRAAGFCVLFMGAAFAGVQCARTFLGVEVPCYCLGVLGNFPPWIELGVDLLLIGLAIIVVQGRDCAVRGLRGRYGWLLLILPAVLPVIVTGIREPPQKVPGGQVILQRLRAGLPASPDDERGIVLCLDLDDFRCSICFDDLISLLDTIRSVDLPAWGKGAAAVLRLSEGDADSCAWRLHRWARETGITGPLAVVSAEEFDEATGGKSVVWLAQGLDRVVRVWDLPLGPALRGEVLSSLAGR